MQKILGLRNLELVGMCSDQVAGSQLAADGMRTLARIECMARMVDCDHTSPFVVDIQYRLQPVCGVYVLNFPC